MEFSKFGVELAVRGETNDISLSSEWFRPRHRVQFWMCDRDMKRGVRRVVPRDLERWVCGAASRDLERWVCGVESLGLECRVCRVESRIAVRWLRTVEFLGLKYRIQWVGSCGAPTRTLLG